MPSNFTENYNLSQWARTDKVQMEDFNADNAKIDGALTEEKSAREALAANTAAALAKLGNCKIHAIPYVGDGTSGTSCTRKFQFPVMPLAVVIIGGDAMVTCAGGSDRGLFHSSGSNSYFLALTWKGNTLSWLESRADRQMNNSGTPYCALGFCSMD